MRQILFTLASSHGAQLFNSIQHSVGQNPNFFIAVVCRTESVSYLGPAQTRQPTPQPPRLLDSDVIEDSLHLAAVTKLDEVSLNIFDEPGFFIVFGIIPTSGNGPKNWQAPGLAKGCAQVADHVAEL